MIYRNQILLERERQLRWRILDEADSREYVWVICMDIKMPLPVRVLRQTMEDKEQFSPVDRPAESYKPKMTVAAKQRQEKAFAAIQPLVATQDIFEANKRSAMVLARARELGKSPQTLYAYLRLWWCNGQTQHALTLKFDKIGTAPGEIGLRGRPSKFGTPIYALKKEDRDNFDKALKYFLNEKLATLEAAFDKLIMDHYSFVDGENRLINHPPGERPSKAQFTYYAKKKLPLAATLRKKKGDIEFALQHRPVLGSVRGSTYTVADVYEIDATIVDVFLVYIHNRQLLIGKPCLYLIIDRKSGLIVGFYIGLENASWGAARQAIFSISQDKQKLCEANDVPYDPAEWPAHGVMPKEFVGDRGPEMIGNESKKIADELELTVTNLPARRPDWKPVVEVGNKQIQQPMRASISGYIPPNTVGKRKGKDYAADAVMTLPAFKTFIIKTIIKHNSTPIENYPMAPAAILSGMQPTPINIWNTEIRERAGLPNFYSEEEVLLPLLSRTTVSVTREGIRQGDRYYSAPEAMERDWFVAAGRKAFPVTASCDLNCVDTILIHDAQSPSGYFVATLLEKSDCYRGLSHREAEALAYMRAQIRQEGEALALQQRTGLIHDTDTLIKAETAETKKVCTGKSRSSRKKDTAAARKDERRQERQSSGMAAPQRPQHETPAPVIHLPAVRPVAANPPSQSTTPQKAYQQKYEDLLNGR